MEAKQLKQFKMQIYSFTDTGNRNENEDVIHTVTLNEQFSFHLLADGMGGYGNGKLAAKTIVENISYYLTSELTENSDIELMIYNAIQNCNNEIKSIRTSIESKLGATIAGVIAINKVGYCFWIGDVRILYLKNKRIQFQSKDHSLINELINSKQILTPLEIERYRHIVTKSIQGNNEIIEPGLMKLDNIVEWDKIIICTDGVHNVVTPFEMESLLENSEDDQKFMNKVEDNCNKYSSDNYSMVLINF